MMSYVKTIATWLVLAGHVFFGWWMRKKVDGASDAVALRAGNAKAHNSPANKQELMEDLEEGKL